MLCLCVETANRRSPSSTSPGSHPSFRAIEAASFAIAWAVFRNCWASQGLLHRRRSQNGQRSTRQIDDQLSPDSVPYPVGDFNFQPPLIKHSAKASRRASDFPSGRPRMSRLRGFFRLDHSRRGNRASGISDRTHYALGGAMAAVRSDCGSIRGSDAPLKHSSLALQVPPGNAIQGEQHQRFIAQ